MVKNMYTIMSEERARVADEDEGTNRRRILRLLGTSSVAALAGCASLEGNGNGNGHGNGESRPDDWCVEENDVEVPEAFRTAESIDGIQRNPGDLSSRQEAAYQCHPQGYQLCANCRFFIPGIPTETGDGVGACAIVEGRMRSQDWCALYQESERLGEFPDPDPGREGQQKPPESN